MKLSGKRVLVTGGTGLIGAAICRHLAKAGVEVATLSRRGGAGAQDIPQGLPGDTHSVRGDITDRASLDFGGFDAVVHAAAEVSFGHGKRGERAQWRSNVDGTRHVLDAARAAGVDRVLHVSSIAAIGDCHGARRDESYVWERPQTFNSHYELTKYEAHKLALSSPDLDVVAVMPSVVLGLARHGSGRLLATYFDQKMRFMVDHPGRMGWVHVEDVAAGSVAALARGNGAYILSEACLTMPQWYARMEAATGVPAPRRIVPFPLATAGIWTVATAARLLRFHTDVSMDFIRSLRRDTDLDNRRALEDLGWEPDMDSHVAADLARWRAAAGV